MYVVCASVFVIVCTYVYVCACMRERYGEIWRDIERDRVIKI